MKPGLQIASGLFIISKRDFRWRRVNIQAVYKVVYKATRQANEVSKCSFWSLLIDNYFFPRKTKKELPYVGGIWTHNTLLSRWALYQPCYQGCYWFKPPTQVKANIKHIYFHDDPMFQQVALGTFISFTLQTLERYCTWRWNLVRMHITWFVNATDNCLDTSLLELAKNGEET